MASSKAILFSQGKYSRALTAEGIRTQHSQQETPGWDRPKLVQISAPPLTSSVTLGTFLHLFEPYLLNRNATVLSSKGYCEN